MSLVKCKDCEAMVSDSATKCPQCGQSLKKGGAGRGFILGAALAAIVGGIEATNGGSPWLGLVATFGIIAFGIYSLSVKRSQTE